MYGGGRAAVFKRVDLQMQRTTLQSRTSLSSSSAAATTTTTTPIFTIFYSELIVNRSQSYCTDVLLLQVQNCGTDIQLILDKLTLTLNSLSGC